MSSRQQVEMPEWMRELAASRPFGPDDRRGTTNLVDDGARARGAVEIRTGETISLARPLRGNDYNSTPEHPGFAHEIWYVPTPDGMGWGQDHVVLNCHGLLNTHIDGLNHVAVDDTFYGGRSVEDPDQGSVDVLARSGLLTRAVYVDVATLHGTPWAQRPVTGEDLDRALAGAGVTFERGDALVVDMGRDRFEAASGHPLGGPESDTDAGGGLSAEGARWVAEHGVSMLVWDMLDSCEAKLTHASAHVLTWAIGLLLVDNCDFQPLRAAIGRGSRVAGALVIAPIVVEGANGVNVNPLILR
jgi:putative cyclase